MRTGNKKKKSKFMQYWFLIQELSGREIKRKYARSFLGILWSVLNPLLTMIVLSVVFTYMFSRNIDHYPVYLLCGQIIYTLFSGITNASMTALVDNKNMLIKVKFPRMIFPLSRGVTALANFGYSLIALAIVMVFSRLWPSIYILFIPFIILFLFLFGNGVGYVLSILYVFFADIKHLYSVLLTLLMYCSAIFYSANQLSPTMKMVISANPVYVYITCFRKCMIYATMPSWVEWMQMAVWGICTYVIGCYVFKKSQNAIMQKL
ncbi:MAG: ABC transporter permease [Lachnospiraceae bacterium]|nr:ABC transporter permease [Lachnospiraceae bacterium]